MEIGKIPNDVLKKIVLDKIPYKRDDVLIGPKIGEDCCAVDFGQYACVLSTDPITGAANEIGRLAVHISCNDVASSGVQPLGLLMTILAPPESTESELEIVMSQICETAASLNVDILGGHTEVTPAVNRFVVSSTAIGKALKHKLVSTSGANPGDDIIMTKTAGLEGTAIIAHDKEDVLREKLQDGVVERAKEFINSISVVKEGVISGEFGVSSMHDATEGGVLGAVWEIAEASGVGVEVHRENIPVAQETIEISKIFNIDPLRLISSGCMIITCSDGNGLVNILADNGVKSAIIGKVVQGNKKLLIDMEREEEFFQPGADELYKAI